MRPRVAILLSTFDGERYVREQLDSLNAQALRDWLLYWRDDGSTDGTPGLVRAFCATVPSVEVPASGRVGATGSFLLLLRAALAGPAECFAFADQDDVWLPQKLANGAAALARVPAERPALFFCARTIVDEALRTLREVPAPAGTIGFPAALTQNVAPGCCMMLNRAAAELVASEAPPEGSWHDWWAYLLVSAHGGTVVAGKSADILYRQHGGNLVGEAKGFWHRAATVARRGPKPFVSVLRQHLATLQEGSRPLPADVANTVDRLQRAGREGVLARARALRIPGLVRQTWAETTVFRLWFLIG